MQHFVYSNPSAWAVLAPSIGIYIYYLKGEQGSSRSPGHRTCLSNKQALSECRSIYPAKYGRRMASNTKRRNEVQMNGNVILSSEFNDNDDFKEIKMRKILIIGIALSLILVSGGLFSAQANCGGGCLSSLSPCNWNLSALSPCNWHFPSLCGFGFTCGSKEVNSASVRDADRQYVTHHSTPDLMGSPGF